MIQQDICYLCTIICSANQRVVDRVASTVLLPLFLSLSVAHKWLAALVHSLNTNHDVVDLVISIITSKEYGCSGVENAVDIIVLL